MSWIKKKYQETKEGIQKDWAERKKANAETRAASREAYYKTRKEQQIILARRKAILEGEQRERQLKTKYAPRPVRTSNINYSPMSMQPSSMMSPGYFATAKPKTLTKIVKTKRKKSKRKGKKKGKAKYIIRGGVAYPVG